MGGHFFFRALFAVLVFGAVAAIGAGLYHAGYNQGLDSTATGTVIVAREHWGFAPFWGFFGLLFPLFFFFLIFSFIGRMLWWGRGGGWGGPGHGGPGGHGWKSREEMLDDWHKHQHETPSATQGTAPEQRS